MTIYIELIFISNFFADLFIITATLCLLKVPRSAARGIISSLFGATAASLVPFCFRYMAVVQIVCLLSYPFLIRKCRKAEDYVVTLCAFSIVTISLGGIMYGIKIFLRNYMEENGTSVIVTLFCLSALCVLWILSEIYGKFFKQVSHNRRTFKVILSDGKKERTFYAFYDSGNRVYANNGEPVTIVDYDVYTMFCGEEERLYVSTINGITELRAKDAKIKIYSEDFDNRIYRTKIASSPEIVVREQIILHGDMFGGQHANYF